MCAKSWCDSGFCLEAQRNGDATIVAVSLAGFTCARPHEGVYVVRPPAQLDTFAALLDIVSALRGPEGCPWDKEQTNRTLTPFAIEEAHELAEAIEDGTDADIVSELGDLLLQVALHAEIGRQEDRFDIHDVLRAINSKMVRRHPHVFSEAKASTTAEVLTSWAAIKAQEKASRPEQGRGSMRFDISPTLPALSRANKIGEKTRSDRFDWQNAEQVLVKVDEELAEVKEVMRDPRAGRTALEHEIGDLLFSVAQLARHLGLEPEQCLRTANTRFEKRFFTMKKMIREGGRDYGSLNDTELEHAWQEVKRFLRHDGA